MKKNVMMRVASIMLVLVLMTSSVISGTFAKYVTDGSGSDNARVAKFGVTITAESTMFLDQYKTDDGTYTGDYSVKTSNGDKLVAPGTAGDMVSLAITGTPEVATRVTYTPEVNLGNNWIDKDDMSKFYCPIVIKVWKDGAVVNELCGLDYASAALFEEAIETAIVDKTVDYDPNQDLSVVNDDLDITWEWPFEVADHNALNHTHGDGAQTDPKDTFLGDRAAGDIGNAGTINISLTVTVTQID